jgi:hypothetical protein
VITLQRFLILLFSIVLLSSCVSNNTKDIALTVNSLANQYSMVKLIVSSKYDNFSKKEQVLVDELDFRITNIINQLSERNISLIDYRELYLNTMYSYSKVKELLLQNKDKFETSESSIIMKFDDNVVKLNQLISKPIVNKQYIIEIVRQMVSLSMLVATSL